LTDGMALHPVRRGLNCEDASLQAMASKGSVARAQHVELTRFRGQVILQ